jgi:hypothetical protein
MNNLLDQLETVVSTTGEESEKMRGLLRSIQEQNRKIVENFARYKVNDM